LNSFLAYRIYEYNGSSFGKLEKINISDLGSTDLFIKVDYSAINYKDALAATGKAKIAKKTPLVGGIDLVGTVLESKSSDFTPGCKIIATGSGLSETLNGGYSEYAKIDSKLAYLIPKSFSSRLAAAIGTAGFTAALAIYKMKINNQLFSNKKIVVTGATGGVGSFVIILLKKLSAEIIAVSGKDKHHDYLFNLGANEIINRNKISFNKLLLEKGMWHGAIDNLGGDILSWLIKTTISKGNIASIGLASSYKLNTNVMPLILRGINILGISTDVSREMSQELWGDVFSLLTKLDVEKVLTREISINDLPKSFEDYIKSNNIGRTIVNIGEY
tara:strand:- start:722 stop:1714 length:993 start_codon:yes stop_codon:yes gene_type:complete